MKSMDYYPRAAMERAMKVQEVILQAMARKISWYQAAEIIGISDRHMRRWRERYEEGGFRGLFDRRRGKPSPKRVPVAVVEQVLQLYREKYFDLNLSHFHEKLASQHQIELSYSWVKGMLQGAGLVARGRKRSASQTAGAAAVAGNAVAHRRPPASVVSGRALVRPDRDLGRCHQRDLLRAAGGGRIDGDGAGGAARSDRAQRCVLRLVQRSREPFLADAEGRRQGRCAPSYAGGTGVARAGHSDDSGLLAASARPQRAQLLDLAGTAAAGVAAAPNHPPGSRQCVSAPTIHGGVQPAFSGAAGAAGKRLSGLPQTGSGLGLCPAVRAHGEPRPHGELSESVVADGAGGLACHAGGLPGDRAPASRGHSQHHPRTPLAGALHGAGHGAGGCQNAGATGCGKDAGWKSHEADFPLQLGHPANCAGFPLSHSPDCCWLTKKPDISCAKKTGPFNLLRTQRNVGWYPASRL